MAAGPWDNWADQHYTAINIERAAMLEAGDPSRPIWSGCFWTTQTIPLHAAAPTVRTIASTTATVTDGGPLPVEAYYQAEQQ